MSTSVKIDDTATGFLNTVVNPVLTELAEREGFFRSKDRVVSTAEKDLETLKKKMEALRKELYQLA